MRMVVAITLKFYTRMGMGMWIVSSFSQLTISEKFQKLMSKKKTLIKSFVHQYPS